MKKYHNIYLHDCITLEKSLHYVTTGAYDVEEAERVAYDVFLKEKDRCPKGERCRCFLEAELERIEDE